MPSGVSGRQTSISTARTPCEAQEVIVVYSGVHSRHRSGSFENVGSCAEVWFAWEIEELDSGRGEPSAVLRNAALPLSYAGLRFILAQFVPSMPARPDRR